MTKSNIFNLEDMETLIVIVAIYQNLVILLFYVRASDPNNVSSSKKYLVTKFVSELIG